MRRLISVGLCGGRPPIWRNFSIYRGKKLLGRFLTGEKNSANAARAGPAGGGLGKFSAAPIIAKVRSISANSTSSSFEIVVPALGSHFPCQKTSALRRKMSRSSLAPPTDF